MNARVVGLFLVILLAAGTLQSARAGSRDLSHLGITNATLGDEPAISQRLFVLLQRDIKEVYGSEDGGFGWEPGVKLKVVPCPTGLFKPLITPASAGEVASLVEKEVVHDGLIVYQYDTGQKKVRLKLFDAEGKERILIRLPLEPDGPMKDSVMRGTRRAALVAIGGAIDFVP